MHTIARASSFASLPSGSSASACSPYYHHPTSYGATSQSRSEPATPSEPTLPAAAGVWPYSEATPTLSNPQQTPTRGCLKPPTKEFATKCEPTEVESQISTSSSGRQGSSGTRRRPNMKLERLPSNAIARIQMAEGVEPQMIAEQGKNATGSGAKGKCKQRVPTPYVKSDKSSWLSEEEE